MAIKSKSLNIFVLYILLFFCIISPQPLHQNHHPNRVIVKYTPHVKPSEKISFRKELNAKKIRHFKLTGAELLQIESTTTKMVIRQYRSDARIEYIEPDYLVHLPMAAAIADDRNVILAESQNNYDREQVIPNDPYFYQQWGLHNEGYYYGIPDSDIDAPEAWTIQTDCDILIGVIDTGIDYNHEDLDGNIWSNPNEGVGDFIGFDDGCPGVCGIDDDEDALTTAEENTTDHIDNDGDGLIDETGIDTLDEDVMMADYNNNGIWLVGVDGEYGTEDDDLEDVNLAAYDDDENGYNDDLLGWDWGDNDSDPSDDHGHGTWISGIIGAEGNNSIGITGLCWSAQLMPLKVFYEVTPDSFVAEISDIILALEYSIEKGAKLTNNSWGFYEPDTSLSLYNAIVAGNDQLFITGAGNDGINIDETPYYPSSFDLENIISTSYTDRYDSHNYGIVNPSNYGSISVDLAAPGYGIISSAPQNDYIYPITGTSFSAAFVTGAVGLLWSEESDLTNLEIKHRLITTVDPLMKPEINHISGGRLNVFSSIQPPTVNISPPGLIFNLNQYSTYIDIITIHNSGIGSLNWWLCRQTSKSYMVGKTEGFLSSGESDTLSLHFSDPEIEPGTYYDTLTFRFNDPNLTQYDYPIELTIESALSPEIQFSSQSLYVSVLNGDSAIIPLVVTNPGPNSLNWEIAGLNPGINLSGIDILWDQSHGAPTISIFYNELISDLVSAGATISENDDPITPLSIESYEVLYSRIWDIPFTENEIQAVKNWIEAGGAFIVEGDVLDLTSFNSILSGSGIEYSKINVLSGIETIYVHPITLNVDEVHYTDSDYYLGTRSHISINAEANMVFGNVDHSIISAEVKYGNGTIFASSVFPLGDSHYLNGDNRLYGEQLFSWLCSPLKPNIISGYLDHNESDTILININTERLEEGSYDALLTFFSNRFETVEIPVAMLVIPEDSICMSNGDVNIDGTTNILDIILTVDFILDRIIFIEVQYCNADINEDDNVNILDIVLVVNIILI